MVCGMNRELQNVLARGFVTARATTPERTPSVPARLFAQTPEIVGAFVAFVLLLACFYLALGGR